MKRAAGGANCKRRATSAPTLLSDAYRRISAMEPDVIQQRIAELGEWFHNINLRGHLTAPDHFLGDYPAIKWRRFASALPDNLQGRTVLDIGCNGGFYSIEMK